MLLFHAAFYWGDAARFPAHASAHCSGIYYKKPRPCIKYSLRFLYQLPNHPAARSARRNDAELSRSLSLHETNRSLHHGRNQYVRFYTRRQAGRPCPFLCCKKQLGTPSGAQHVANALVSFYYKSSLKPTIFLLLEGVDEFYSCFAQHSKYLTEIEVGIERNWKTPLAPEHLLGRKNENNVSRFAGRMDNPTALANVWIIDRGIA